MGRLRVGSRGVGWEQGRRCLNPVLRGVLDVAALQLPIQLLLAPLLVHLPLVPVVEREDALACLRGEVAAGSLRSVRAAAAGRCTVASCRRWARPAHLWWKPLAIEHLIDEPVELRLLGPFGVGHGRPDHGLLSLRPCVLVLLLA